MGEKLKVLIVDDSRVFRAAIEHELKQVDDIQVVGSVWNGVKAMEFIQSDPPDIVTLDIEMPQMDGLETLKAIKNFNATSDYPDIGVIMVSAFTLSGAEVTIKALQNGAYDFVSKPDATDFSQNFEVMINDLIVKLRTYGAKSSNTKPAHAVGSVPCDGQSSSMVIKSGPSNIKAVVIGVSTGGPKALGEILPELSSNVNLPIFIVQHMPKGFTQALADSLDKKCSKSVVEAHDNEIVRHDHIYFAPGGKHLVLRKNSAGQIVTCLNEDPPQAGCRPSADVLFRSAKDVYKGDLVALILTGMGNDGTNGLATLKQAGAVVIAQDKDSSVVWGMPGSAVEAGYVDKILPLNQIPCAVRNIISNKISL